ncbi:hypothetical protein VMF7928_00865 [Vibrio marisflavi CECT 7928]|uniref:Uncharacterized protein n=2 Tax=Vibrio marisflavi TaxID=1216040 RepID=A0ABN8E291_9VIBR|nr:hypothetical protein VMF7928_00865 [Vibrio marisflavi CECT 7928]
MGIAQIQLINTLDTVFMANTVANKEVFLPKPLPNNSISVKSWPVKDLIRIAKLIQAAAGVCDNIYIYLSKDKEIGNHLLNEHLYLINASWLSFNKSIEVINYLLQRVIANSSATFDNQSNHIYISKQDHKEIVTFTAAYEQWQKEDWRTYFGFDVRH